MKILYKQSEYDENSSLNRFGVQNCYFKQLYMDRDSNTTIKSAHHHTGFELHIVTEGYQEYEVEGKRYKLECGSFLLIYPNVKHTVISCAPFTQKFSITFNKQTDTNRNCFFASLTERMSDNLLHILSEASIRKEISLILIENNILDILVFVFRLSGIRENNQVIKQDENVTISLAKQYIDDNIEMAPNVTDVSKYCYLSAKQLTRIFQRFEGISPGEYVINKRIKKIEKLLADQNLSLKQISSMMNFANEYYFNTFFKKYSGMPPGEYRKMLGK